MLLNRVKVPELKLPGKTVIIQPEEIVLDNGLRTYVINSGNEDVVKFEIIFPYSNPDAVASVVAMACHQLTDSGTTKRKAIEIAEELDYFGAFLQAQVSPDYMSFSLYSLGSLFGDSIKILNEILHEASFPESEISNWKKRNIQAYKVNSEKVSWLAKKSFNETVFGTTNAYGYTPDENAYENITREEIFNAYRNNYQSGKCIIILSGKISKTVLDAVNINFGRVAFVHVESAHSPASTEFLSPQKIHIKKEDSVQSAIRIGRNLFSKNHPDYLPLLIANTILGGYFGSRLMSNIREDKGYTYGIGSGLHSYVRAGSFFISTEVGKNVCENAIHEIYYEMQRMAEEPVSFQELDLVRNYLSGAFLRSIDGPFELAERFKGLKLHDLNYDYFDKYLDLLNKITPEEIMHVSSKYLQASTMTEVVAG